jgi:hypothetical protein
MVGRGSPVRSASSPLDSMVSVALKQRSSSSPRASVVANWRSPAYSS